MITTHKIFPIILGALIGCTFADDDLLIESFDSNGQLIFNERLFDADYSIQWAPTPSGPWTNTWSHLEMIQPENSGSITCSVPMFYRVAATQLQGMKLINSGTKSGIDPDFGAYSLTVDSFFIGVTEVSKSEWDEVYNWALFHGYSFENAGSGKASNHPVQNVDWYDCVKWCNARSEMDGRTPCYTVDGNTYRAGQSIPACDFSKNGYRLPTYDEWEYAARGFFIGKRFPWGDEISHQRANYYSSDSYAYDVSQTREYHPSYFEGEEPFTCPVGTFCFHVSNLYGLYDMCGNVAEWCYTETGSGARGGGYGFQAKDLRCGAKYKFNDGAESPSIGFRLSFSAY